MTRIPRALTIAALALLLFPHSSTAQQPPSPEWLCDTQFTDCRTPLLNLIKNETQGIDVAFWFMTDARYVHELIRRHQAGVPIRVLVDQRANASKRSNEDILKMLRDGGIPMRDKYAGDILHWKMMLFHGQNVVQFSKANYDVSMVPIVPNVDYFDEAVYFTNDNNLTNSFRRRYDDLWTNTSQYRNFGNVSGPLARHYPTFSIHSSLNFPPLQDFSNRSVARYDREMQKIDAVVFRVTDHRHADAMIRAVGRNVPVRLITEPTEYRNPTRLWHAKHVDRMYMGGVQIKHRQHQGLMHQASVVLHGLGEVITGSSNWTTASASYQDEHNYFYNPSLGKPWFFQWFVDQFEHKWNNTGAFVPFQPLPPGPQVYTAPSNGATGLSTSSVTLRWDGGTWAHLYDIYFGTNPNPPLIASDREIGSPADGQMESFTITNLLPGTTYYWRIVGKTWAQQTRSGSTWSFTTAGTAPGDPGPGPGSTPFGGTPAAVPGTIEAENFDNGGQHVAYFDDTSGNAGSAYRSTDVDVGSTTDGGGGHYVGWTRAGEWMKYTVNVATTGTYTFEARVAQVGAGATFQVEVDGVNATGPITVPDTGSWQTWQTISKSGVALTAGQRVIRVVFLANASGSGAGNFNWFRLVQSSGSSSTPFGGTPAALPGTLEAENFDNGGQNVAYSDATSGNSGGAYRSTDVDIGPATDTGGGHYVGWTRAGEWLKYTVTVASSGTYTLETRVANVGTGARFRVEVDGVDVTGAITVPDTGGWQSWQTISTSGIPLSAGQRMVRVVFTATSTGGGVGNFNWFRFTQGGSSPPPATSTPFGGTPVPLPGIVQAQNFDDGGQNLAYFDSNSGNSGGVYRNTDVDIGATTDSGSGGHYVGWTRAGEWLRYTVNVTSTRTYTLRVRVANGGTGAQFRVEVDGVDRTGPIAVPDTGSWSTWQTVTINNVPLEQGTRVLRLVMITSNVQNSGVGNYGYLEFQ